MTARAWLTGFVLLTACATTSAPPGTEAAAKEKYDSAVTSCNTTHSYDESVALTNAQPTTAANAKPTGAADAKWQTCLAKAQDSYDKELASIKGTAK